MPDEFSGDPAPLQDSDFAAAAIGLGCSVSALRAVALVESAGGGFLEDGRPKLLFERHVFHARTGGRYADAHPGVSAPRPGGYQGGAGEYDRLSEAIALDRRAALESASWGKFQIMGFNHRLAGHATVQGFVTAMVSGEPAQLAGFVAFIEACKLAGPLARRDWTAFARGYNGVDYARNAYDRKLADTYRSFVRIEAAARPVLKMGDMGTSVRELQRQLREPIDGVFGAATKSAVLAFQRARRLVGDGVVGARTWQALLA